MANCRNLKPWLQFLSAIFVLIPVLACRPPTDAPDDNAGSSKEHAPSPQRASPCETIQLGASSCGPVLVTSDGNTVAVGAWRNVVGRSISDQAVPDGSKVGRLWVIEDGYSLDFSRTNALLAARDTNGFVRGWDVNDGRELFCLALGRSVRSVAFSPDGKTLAIGDGPVVRYWDLAKRESRVVFDRNKSQLVSGGRKSYVHDVAFSPDGRTLAVVVSEGVVMWDTKEERELGLIRTAIHGAREAVFSPDGSLLAIVGGGGCISLWDSSTQKLARELARDPAGHCRRIAFSPDGTLLATPLIHAHARVVIWDTNTGSERSSFSCHGEVVAGVAFFPNGRLLATTGDDHTGRGILAIWDLAAVVGREDERKEREEKEKLAEPLN